MVQDQKPLVYEKRIVNGILFRLDSREVMKQAVAGRHVEVLSGDDYINLYHVFERMQARDKHLAKHTLIRRQIDGARWLLFVVAPGSAVPDVDLADDYDPKRGRYKRFAARLAGGETLRFAERREAIKARRAWQLYVPKEMRRKLRSHFRKSPAGDFLVSVKPLA